MPDQNAPSQAEQPMPANRAARRSKGKQRPPAPHGNGKVHGQRFDHAPDPRQYAAHRRG